MISLNSLKYLVAFFVLAALVMAIYMWSKTPEIFHYFNQAFCAH